MFLFNVPATWQSAAAHRLYAEELRRLGRALCDLGAVPPANAALAETMALYEAARQRLLAGRPSLGSRQFFEELLRYHRDGALESSPSGGPALPLNRRGIALAIVGAPLHPDWAALFDAIELAGGRIELDATALGERALPPPFDRRRLREEPFETLCDAYFGKIPDAFRRPNSQLYRWLRDRLAERGVRGILFHEYTWCDTWRAEFARMKEWASAPIHRLENQGQPRPDPRLLFRLEAFLEMLAASALRRPSL
ncbi:MAG: 2-hydroxyglutaryl-CoA dehydratase, D-component [candidate division BRC1 bacterium ADurb.BinA364]|nr:MAG: 2-hydroxyglutaryl-CoA dehydratase, D-component [candidate division BRC1 bacterium ADurb.BinA364]